MRILVSHFSELGDPARAGFRGGVDTCVAVLTAELRRRGIAVAVAETIDSRANPRMTSWGVPVYPVSPCAYPRSERPRSWFSFARSVAQLERAIGAFRPDIVHVHFPANHSVAVCGAHMLPHAWRLVVTLHNSDVRVYPAGEPLLKRWQERLLGRADAVTTVSRALGEDAREVFASMPRDYDVILNGVGDQWFADDAPSSTQPFVLFAGRLHHIKGVDLLLLAWAALAKRWPDVELWLAGEGPDAATFATLAADLGIASRVRFLGSQPPERLRHLYRQARVTVLPSRAEGLPFSILEASAAGALCVASRFKGADEMIVDGTTGWLAELESVGSLTAVLNRALSLDQRQDAEIRRAAREHAAEHFSAAAMTSRYVELYERVLSRRATRKVAAAANASIASRGSR